MTTAPTETPAEWQTQDRGWGEETGSIPRHMNLSLWEQRTTWLLNTILFLLYAMQYKLHMCDINCVVVFLRFCTFAIICHSELTLTPPPIPYSNTLESFGGTCWYVGCSWYFYLLYSMPNSDTFLTRASVFPRLQKASGMAFWTLL